jgi:GNAT superfamily N-acetyltransferase
MERVMDERYCLFIGPNRIFTSVFPFRLDDVERTLEEVREAAREREVVRVEWWIGPDAEPSDLSERLLGLGLKAKGDSHVASMVLVDEPPAADPAVTARPVASMEELRTAVEVGLEAFGDAEWRREIALQNIASDWEEREGKLIRNFLAFVNGEPVGSARTAYLEQGAVLLISGAVLERARGRGAYRALVRARWDDAAERGTPALIVHAGRMSRPILERLGFQAVAEIDVLEDDVS